LALDDTYAVFKISFATGPHALGKHTGPDIFHFVKTRTGRILTITMNQPNFLLFDSTTTFQLCSTVAR
jgi:hypothetical protein